MSNRRELYHSLLAGYILAIYFACFPETVAGALFFESEVPEVVSYSQSWGDLQFNRSVSQTPLSIRGRLYWKGFGTHAESTIRIRVPADAIALEGGCGIDDQAKGYGEFACSIRQNGKISWETPVIKQEDPIRFFRIAVSPADVVELMIRKAPRGIDYAHANWVRLKFKRR